MTGGKRVSKRSCNIAAIGTVDELNAMLGVARTHAGDSTIAELLKKIQNDCFVLGADLAAPLELKDKVTPRITQEHIKFLEEQINAFSKDLPELNHFILPGGNMLGAHLHLARAVCRRAERKVVAFEKQERINPLNKMYLNRLSDLLFTLARWVNLQEGVKEEEWNTPLR